MTALGQILAGARVTAAMLQGIAPDAAVKPGPETVTFSATLQNDNDLWLSLPATGTWAFLCSLYATSTAALGSGDIKCAFSVPSGASVTWSGPGLSAASSTVTPNWSIARQATGGATLAIGYGVIGASPTPALLFGTVTMGGTSGDLQLQWAQDTASAGNSVTVLAQSSLMGWQIA